MIVSVPDIIGPIALSLHPTCGSAKAMELSGSLCTGAAILASLCRTQQSSQLF